MGRERLYKKLTAALFRLLLAVCLSNALVSSPAFAQMAEGTIGWTDEVSSQKFDSADGACRSQWQHWSGPLSRYIGASPLVGNPNEAQCSWTTFQYLCPQETGGGISSCGTILPGHVLFGCEPGYTPTQGMCLKNPTPECQCARNNGSSANPEVGHPIVLSTGSKVLRADDYSTADGDFSIGRSYRSIQIGRSASFQTAIRGLAGGWNFDFAYEVQLKGFSGSPSSPSAKLALVAPDGTANDFVMQSGGAWVPDTTTGAYYAPTNLKVEYIGTLPSDLSTLQSASTQWRVTDGDDTVWTFQTFTRPNTTSPYAVGRPISRVMRSGYRWDFAYRSDASLQTITDSFGRQASFNWSMFYMTPLAPPPAGWLPWPEAVATVSLPDGTSLRYTYDPPPATAAPSTSNVQRLIKVERLDTAGVAIDSTSYSYGDTRFQAFITAITDFNGNQVASYTYDAAGRGATSTLASGADGYSISNSETQSERVSTVTGPLGKVAEYHFQFFGGNTQDIRLSSIVGEASPNTPASSRSITYGPDNFIATETDDEGRVTSYSRDTRGRPTTIVEASGTPQARTTTITWDAAYNQPDRIVLPGLQVDYTYTSTGQLQTRTETDTTTQSVPYSTNGQTRTWAYSWGAGGRLASINGPKPVDAQGKDDTLTFVYDAAGNLQTSTNGLGQVTSFANYDANGRPGTMADANGVLTAFTYDPLGRTKTVTVKHPSDSSLDAVTSFDYDVHNRVIGVTSPATDKLFVDYDRAGRLVAVRAASGERIDYQTDAHGNVTTKTVKRADASVVRTVARTFDELGRLLTQTLGPSRTTTWAYDKVSNPKQVTSARNYVTQAAFDPLNRLVSTVAADTGSTSAAYDALDRVSSFTDPISVQTTYVRDGFGDVIQEISPDRGASIYYYNEAGEQTARIDGRGQRVDYTRDILGRIMSKTPAGRSSETVTYTWDTPGITGSYAVGRLSSVTDGTGTTSFAYDHRGNLIDKRQTISGGMADLAYANDLADRIAQITYPSGRVVAYDRDSKGRVTQVRTKASASDPNWVTLASAITYEPWGSITGGQFGNGLSLSQSWTDGRLASKRLTNMDTGADVSSLAYLYDNDDNIGSIRDLLNDANSIYYGYDGNDRLSFASMTVASPSASSATYSYAAGSNRLSSLMDETGTRSISYDARGNTIGETRPGGATVSTSYDGYGRLLTYARTGDASQTNVYNGLDERVSVTSGSTTHSFVYDPDGRLIGEYDASGAPVAETIWLSPSITNDNEPIGGDDGVGGYAPLAIATGSGASAQLYWVHGNHLGVPIVTTDASGQVASPTGYTVLGFPGQTKTLADLYYNRYRDYDSSLGRYIQADPIGLRGGSNPFLYAGANPLRYTDPSGRCIEDLCIGEALIIGSAYSFLDYIYQRLVHPNCVDYGEVVGSGVDAASTTILLAATLGGGGAAFEAAATEGEVADGLIYLRTDTTGKLAPYVGQTTEANELARQAAHARAYPNSRFEFETLESGIPKGSQLDIAEHNAIQARTGGVAARRSSAVSNQRDPVGPRRRPTFGLPEPR
jgi:RHS repeat-associated protein